MSGLNHRMPEEGNSGGGENVLLSWRKSFCQTMKPRCLLLGWAFIERQCGPNKSCLSMFENQGQNRGLGEHSLTVPTPNDFLGVTSRVSCHIPHPQRKEMLHNSFCWLCSSLIDWLPCTFRPGRDGGCLAFSGRSGMSSTECTRPGLEHQSFLKPTKASGDDLHSP